MKVKNLAIAISAALVISPLPVLAKCITDGMGNISCKSSGFNDVFHVQEGQEVNKYSLETKGYTTMENRGDIDTARFTGSGSRLNISNYGYIKNVAALNVAGDIFLQNHSKVGVHEVAPELMGGIELTSTSGKVSLVNNGEYTGDTFHLSSPKNISIENNGTMHGWILDARTGGWDSSGPISLTNTGELDFLNIYLQSWGSDISVINHGTLATEAELDMNGGSGNSALTLINTGLMNASSQISARKNSSASIVNTGTISNSPEHSDTLNVQSDLVEIYNSGIIENTLEGGYAIQGGGDDNASLYLAGDWQINGHVRLEGKISRLGLTGDSDSFLDISRIRNTDWENLPPDSIMGFNTLEKTGSSLWTLYGEQTSGGFTTATIDEGGLLLSNATLRMAPVTGEDTDDSTAPRHALTNNAALYSEGASVLNGSLVNNGAVFMNNGATTRPVFNTLTVTGDYTGQKGSTLVFNTRLGNDRSQTDRLMIKGNTAGESQVIVNNLGGKGAQTVEGIKLISVDGQSDGVFRKADGTRIVAGAYDYDLAKSDGQNWYLSSSAAKASAMMLSAEMANDAAPAAVTAAGAAPTLTAAARPAEKVWRPESGSYAANLLAANTLFNTTLHDRAGESQYTDILTGEQRVTSMWLRNVGGHQRSKMSDGQNKTQANRYVMQLGGDVAQWSSSGSDRYHLGVMAGYANQKSRTHSSVSDYRSRGQINGYSAGMYGTWYANNADKSGLYVDSWLQYGWFNNSVKGDAIASESYKSRGLTGSLETGYAIKVGETTSRNDVVNSFWLQPQAQATWMGVKAKKHTETNGTRVEGKGQDNVQTRLGLKAYMQGHSALDNNQDRTFQPYVAANWIHNTKKMGVMMDGESNHISGAKNLGEVKVGVEGQLNRNLNLWGGFAQQIGAEGYSDSQASVGIKYQF